MFIPFVAVAMVAVALIWTAPPTTFYLTAGWILIIALLLWWGNRKLTSALDRLMPWSRSGSFRLFVQLSSGLLYLLVLINITYLVLKLVLTTDPPTIEQVIVTNVFGAFIFIPTFCIYFSIHFLKHWRLSVLEKEKMQKEQIRSQLISLRNQLDPHFLFNNLNILSALIDKDPGRSKRFLEKFSDVYRSLLRSKSEDLIKLTEELEFIEAYIFLMRTRFDDQIQFTKNLQPGHASRMIPPLTLQILVENAVKHNTINETTPLTIHLLQLDDDYLMVSNTLSHTPNDIAGHGSGLINIQNRYAYFTGKPVRIIRTDTHFEVHIPLLEIDRS